MKGSELASLERYVAAAAAIALLIAAGLLAISYGLPHHAGPDRSLSRKTQNGLFAVVIAICAVLMALSPRTQTMFVVYVLLYAFITGFCYAGYAAVVFETIGRGAAATKANILSGISNVPLIYAGIFDGWGHDRWGSNGLLYTDAALSIAGVMVFIAVALTVRMLAARATAAA